MERWCYSFSDWPVCPQRSIQSGYLIGPVWGGGKEKMRDCSMNPPQLFDMLDYQRGSLFTFTNRLEKIRLEEVEIWMAVLYAFSPWFFSWANTTSLLLLDSTTDTIPFGTTCWLQSDAAACSLKLQNWLQVKQTCCYVMLFFVEKHVSRATHWTFKRSVWLWRMRSGTQISSCSHPFQKWSYGTI